MKVGDDVVYMDYAATSAVRPPEVAQAVAAFLEGLGALPGRAGHAAAREAGRLALHCRGALCGLLGLPGDPGRLAFMHNATHALNTALWGTLRRGDVVVRTVFDHNAVRRPLHRLAQALDLDVRVIPGSPDGALDMDVAERLLDGARMLIVNGASNVLGTPLPVGRLAALAHAAGALVLVDAAQSAGQLPMDGAGEGVDLLAITGHKALLGPQGTGGLWVRENVDVEPLLIGGSGGEALCETMPAAYPEHLEAGTQNAPGMAGLLAGVEWLAAHGVDRVHARAGALKARLRDGLVGVRGLRVLSPPAPGGTPIVTVVPERMDAATLAQRLDEDYGVMTRAGLHCAPEVHALLGTTGSGAVRFSLGWASTESDVDRAVLAAASIVEAPTR